MPQQIKNELKLFADDAKLFTPVDSRSDCESLHNDFNALADWSKRWLLDFRPSKSSILCIGKHFPEFTYHIRYKGQLKFDIN